MRNTDISKTVVRILAIALITTFSSIFFGCSSQPPGTAEPGLNIGTDNNTGIIPGIPQGSQEKVYDARRCIISNDEYYIADMFIYHMNAKGHHIVYTPVNEYLDTGRGVWEVRFHINKDTSIYVSTLSHIEKGFTPDGNKVICEQTSMIPEKFAVFYDTHIEVFQKQMDETQSSEDQISAESIEL